MTVTAASFRADAPEFTDPVRYSDGAINTQISLAGLFLNVDRWYDVLDRGTELYVAHYLVIGARAAMSASAGGIPGAIAGLQTAKAVDKVSASMDVSAVTLADAGHWNSTSYGVQFYQLAMMFGAGPIQL